jgi:hypothetical protein
MNRLSIIEKDQGGENHPDAVQKKHWEQFAKEAGVKPGLVLTRAKDFARKVREKGLYLFQEPFTPHRSDALDRLMEQIGEQSYKIRRSVS